MGIIFDLDQTLVNSSSAKLLRDRRDWNNVYKAIPSFSLYDSIGSLLNTISMSHIPMSIVTSSPKPYCEKIVNYFKLPIDVLVCFYDTKNHKPHPEPILLAANKMGIKELNKILSFGDDAKDIIASNNAKVISVACTWGTDNKKDLLNENPKYICNTIDDMRLLISKHFNL